MVVEINNGMGVIICCSTDQPTTIKKKGRKKEKDKTPFSFLFCFLFKW